jgi:hypothetical protein
VPINSVTLAVTTSNFQAFFYDTATNAYKRITTAGSQVSTNGSASGIGDVTVTLKQLVLGREGSRPAVSAGFSMRFPSGDALNYLGSGAYGGNVFGLFEYRARVAPHLKLSYQWNDYSQLMDLQAAPSIRLPGGLQYAAGADIKVVRPLTLAVDVLGNQFVNTPSFSLNTVPVSSLNSAANATVGSGINPNYTTVTGLSNTYTTANISTGLKWSPFPHFLLYGNVLLQMNNVGLRSDPVPLFGIAYNFGKRK